MNKNTSNDGMSYSDRLAANEVIFREHNKQMLQIVKENTEKLKGSQPFLRFYCECSSPFCMEQVKIGVNAYIAVHRNPKYFIVKPGHERLRVEHVIEKRKNYYVVEKYDVPPTLEEAVNELTPD